MKTLKVLTIVAITGLAGTVAANACPAGANKTMCQKKEMCKSKKGKRGEMKELFEKLDLTSEQKTSMKENRQKMHVQMKERRAQKHAKHSMLNMSEFVSANGFDKQAFIEMSMQKAQSRIEKRAERFAKTMHILTPEQRIKLVTLLQEKQK